EGSGKVDWREGGGKEGAQFADRLRTSARFVLMPWGRYPVPAFLTLATTATLARARSLYAMSLWGSCRRQWYDARICRSSHAYAMSTATALHHAFKRSRVLEFEAALQGWSESA